MMQVLGLKIGLWAFRFYHSRGALLYSFGKRFDRICI